MNRQQLEHIIRAAADVTDEYDIVVIGSQSILGSCPNAPRGCLVSMEADVFPLNAEHKADDIDAAIGEFSPFHEMNGFYAQGVDSTTAVLPDGWRDRLVRVQNENTNGRAGWCLDPVDLFLSKCVANREKDRVFNMELVRSGIVKPEVATARADVLPIDYQSKARVVSLIRRLADQAIAPSPLLGGSLLSVAPPSAGKEPSCARATHPQPPKP